LAAQTALGERVRVLLDKRPGKATQKRWGWVKKGVPLILEIGGRDAESGQVSVLRRHRLYTEGGKADFHSMARDRFVEAAAAELENIQRELYEEARQRRNANLARGLTTMDEVAAFFAEDRKFPGWVELGWSRPTGAELEAVEKQLKALKLTIRNTPLGGDPVAGTCPFTGKPAVERIYVARAY